MPSASLSTLRDTQQLTPLALRQRMLELAGFGSPEQAQLVRKALGKIERMLGAKKTQLVTFEGEITDRVDMEDNAAQLRAAEALARLMGVEPSKDVNAGAVKVTVEVKLPEWAKPTIDITPFEEEGAAVEEAVKSPASE